MKKINYLLFCLLLVFFTSVNSQTVQQIGYYNINGIHSMSSKTNLMVLGSGSIVDISNPSSPALAGNLSLSGFSTSVLVDGNFAYFGTGMNVKLIIANISNPGFPMQVGTKNFPQFNGGIFGMAKKNNVLFLALGGDGVYTIDVTNANNPVAMDSIAIPNGQARDVATLGNYAYVAHNDGMKIMDITNPANISIVYSIGSGYNSIGIDSANSLVFLGKNSGGIDVYSISNPAVPAPAFAIPNAGGTAWDLKCSNNHLYFSTDNSGLFIYRYNKVSATSKAQFSNAGNGQSFAVSLQDSLILLSGLIKGVAILKYDSLGVVGITDELKTEQLTLFPNPAGGYFEFSGPSENISDIEIRNEKGDLIMKPYCRGYAGRIDISALANGIYTVNFKNEKAACSRKLIKIKQ